MIDFEEKTGSVMVVGGGIAGIHAALDLANSGYYVYLIERTGVLGGTIGRLDETSRTVDAGK